ncbi:MAG: hypothetical protein OXH15_11710 [Gammaproteobacteria bacterium]|nr:hypothetical protein [Gammaproteobacteria bacterium]
MTDDLALPLWADAECGDYSYAPLSPEDLRAAVGLGSIEEHDTRLTQLHFVAIAEVVQAMGGVPPIPSPRTDAYAALRRTCLLSMRASVEGQHKPVVTVAGVGIAPERVTLVGRQRVVVAGDLPEGRAKIAYTTEPKDGAQYAGREAVRQLVGWHYRTSAGETGRNGRPLRRPDVEAMLRPYGLPSAAQVVA